MENVDFGRTASDYARHRQGFPDVVFERLRERGVGLPGQRVLDLGTGTGQMARGLARDGASVTGLDRSEDLVAEARRLDREAGVAVDYFTGRAEETGLSDAAFDVVTAAQCWTWFDRPRAAAEALRLLVPGGRLVIAQLDWLPLPGSLVAATEELILAHNPSWHLGGGDGMYPHYAGDAADAGFADVETFTFDLDLRYTHEAWRGRIRASAGVGATLSPAGVERFDAEHAALLAERFSADPLAVPHRVFAVIGRRP